jgi:hypothetical protein
VDLWIAFLLAEAPAQRPSPLQNFRNPIRRASERPDLEAIITVEG